RTLRAGAPARKGERVVLLGIPSRVPRDEDDLFGRVREASDAQLEIELDATADLRGWGGAPVVSREDGRVVGVVQAAKPTGTTLLVSASPIAAALEAAAAPLDGGAGRPFARVADSSPAARAAAAKSPPAADRAPAARQARAEPEPAGRGREARRGSLLGKSPVVQTRDLWLEIEHPADGAVFGAAHGAFVAGRALAP